MAKIPHKLPQVQFNTRISPQTWADLDEYSKKTGESKASIVDAALREYLEKRKEGWNLKWK